MTLNDFFSLIFVSFFLLFCFEKMFNGICNLFDFTKDGDGGLKINFKNG